MPRSDGSIGGHTGTAFGRTVTFEDPNAEAPRPGIHGRLLKLLRTRKQIAQAAKIIRVSLAGVAIEECVRAEQHRAIEIIKSGWHHPVMQRRGIKKDIQSADERQQ